MYTFFRLFFSGKNIILCILKGISPFKMHKIIFRLSKCTKLYFFQKTCKKDSPVNLGRVGLT